MSDQNLGQQDEAEDTALEGVKMLYRVFGWWYRWQACKMAARVMQGRQNGDEAISPLVWSLTVFFETYMTGGSEATSEDFGPKDPVTLKTATIK